MLPGFQVTHQASEPATPGGGLQYSRMPGHWLLARMGKRVLRPGGIELTRQMLDALNIRESDDVVEFAPGRRADFATMTGRGFGSSTADLLERRITSRGPFSRGRRGPFFGCHFHRTAVLYPGGGACTGLGRLPGSCSSLSRWTAARRPPLLHPNLVQRASSKLPPRPVRRPCARRFAIRGRSASTPSGVRSVSRPGAVTSRSEGAACQAAPARHTTCVRKWGSRSARRPEIATPSRGSRSTRDAWSRRASRSAPDST